MTCIKEVNLKNGWNKYCTGINNIKIGKWRPFKNDTIFGVYIGCACKKHDIRYSEEGSIYSRKIVDALFMQDVYKEYRLSGMNMFVSRFVSVAAWLLVRTIGPFHWKRWSIEGLLRYN
jgi:hypothetical protein